MKIKPTVLAPIAFAFVAALAPCASQAELVTMTTKGTIFYGTDRIGLFVEQNHALDGLPYMLSITVDTSQLVHTRDEQWPWHRMDGSGQVTGSLTVADKTYSWNVPAGRNLEVALDGYLNRLRLGGVGINATDGWYVGGYSQIGIDQPRGGWVTSVELDRDMAFSDYISDGTARSEFGITIPGYPAPPDAPRDWSMSTWFGGEHPDQVLWTVSPVPEPSQYAMLLIGVGAIAALRRRRSSTMRPRAA